ncbi:MAG: CinA family nicotinamide mononucleotide deamidase-related protein [Bacteriovorax sp.]|nr:CinA family nicotinamide mononucleotide deamidase-related protein [Bacteriovorax sp.]
MSDQNASIRKNLKVSMIVIGDEILNGRTTDLNGSWLAKYLFKMGLEFKALRFIHDDIDEINQALSASLDESDIVITSGGIGPTLDDKTKNTLANFFQKKIIERQDVADIVTNNYIQFGRSWLPSQNHYHFFPEDFIATNNPRGLAPGIVYFEKSRNKLMMAGPGVPREFTEIVEKEFFPLIKKYFSDRFQENYQTVLRTIGVAEETIFFELCPTLWTELEKFGKVSSLPHTIGIDIVISYHGNLNEHEKTRADIQKLVQNSALAKHVWQYGNKPLNEMVLELAIQKKVTFSLAESCTGGLVASKITDLSGSSSVFMGGVVTYANETKIDLLGVKPKTIEDFGAVSIEVATEMAAGAILKFKTDYAVSITGIAGPTGATADKPLGTVIIGFATKNKTQARRFLFPGDRIRRKERFSDMALMTLLKLMNDEI